MSKWQPSHLTRSQAIEIIRKAAEYAGYEEPDEFTPIFGTTQDGSPIAFDEFFATDESAFNNHGTIHPDLNRYMDLSDETINEFRLFVPGSPFSDASKELRPSDADLAKVRMLGEFLDAHGPSIARAHAAHEAAQNDEDEWWDNVRGVADALELEGIHVSRDSDGDPDSIRHPDSPDEFHVELDLLAMPCWSAEEVERFVRAWLSWSRLERQDNWILKGGVVNPLVVRAVEAREAQLEEFQKRFTPDRNLTQADFSHLQWCMKQINKAYNRIVQSETEQDPGIAKRLAAARELLDVAATFIETGAVPEPLGAYLLAIEPRPGFVKMRKVDSPG